MRELGKIEHYIMQIAHAHPLFARFARQLRFIIRIILMRLRESKDLEVNKVIWVDPKKIEYTSLELDPILNMGIVLGGNWDKSRKKFDNSNVYISFKKRFIDNEEWTNTSFYKELIYELKRGKILWGCTTKNELDKRFKKIDILYNEIRKYGYKLNKNVRYKHHKYYDPYKKEDEITVNIGRNGEILFNDGRHRLTIVKILNINKIPIKVVARHTEWMKIRSEFKKIAKMSGGKLYQPLIHPDLQDIPSKYGSFRYKLIKKNLSLYKGRLLDIGAHLGYFCSRFAEDGFDCYAVESDPLFIHFLKKIRNIDKVKFEIIPYSIFEYNHENILSFDIVLALNVFHHFLKSKKSYDELVFLLKRIKTKEMYFQSHNYEEIQMKGAYKNYNPEEFAYFISKHTELNYKFIGETEDNRTIYKFFKEDVSQS